MAAGRTLKGASPLYRSCGRRQCGLGPGRLPGQPGICGRAVPLSTRQGRPGWPRGAQACGGRNPETPRDRAQRRYQHERLGTNPCSLVRKSPSTLRKRACHHGVPIRVSGRGRFPDRPDPAPEQTHTPALVLALTSPGAPGAGAPTLEGAVGPWGRAGRRGSRWLRRAICLCSRSTSRWDSRSNRSKSRICSHWGPSWGGATRSRVSPRSFLAPDHLQQVPLSTVVGRFGCAGKCASSHAYMVGHISMSMQPHASPGPWADIHNNSFTGRSQCSCTVLNFS